MLTLLQHFVKKSVKEASAFLDYFIGSFPAKETKNNNKSCNKAKLITAHESKSQLNVDIVNN